MSLHKIAEYHTSVVVEFGRASQALFDSTDAFGEGGDEKKGDIEVDGKKPLTVSQYIQLLTQQVDTCFRRYSAFITELTVIASGMDAKRSEALIAIALLATELTLEGLHYIFYLVKKIPLQDALQRINTHLGI